MRETLSLSLRPSQNRNAKGSKLQHDQPIPNVPPSEHHSETPSHKMINEMINEMMYVCVCARREDGLDLQTFRAARAGNSGRCGFMYIHGGAPRRILKPGALNRRVDEDHSKETPLC
jgi:hypothetical protein